MYKYYNIIILSMLLVVKFEYAGNIQVNMVSYTKVYSTLFIYGIELILIVLWKFLKYR